MSYHRVKASPLIACKSLFIPLCILHLVLACATLASYPASQALVNQA